MPPSERVHRLIFHVVPGLRAECAQGLVPASCGSKSNSWPQGKGVKIAFEGINFIWKPDKESFADVMKGWTGLDKLQDFKVSYEDQEGDEIQVDVMKQGIVEFLADHRNHENPKLKAEWCQGVGFVRGVVPHTLWKEASEREGEF